MPAFKQKNVIKSFKRRILTKVKSIAEETQDVTSLLEEIVSKFQEKVRVISDVEDESFFIQYQKLNQNLENYLEKLFFVQATLDGAAEDDGEHVSDCSVENIVQTDSEQQFSNYNSVADLVESFQTTCISKNLDHRSTSGNEPHTSPISLQISEKINCKPCPITSEHSYASARNFTDVCETSQSNIPMQTQSNLILDVLPVNLNQKINSSSQLSDSQDSYYRSLSSHSNDPIFDASEENTVNISQNFGIAEEFSTQERFSELNATESETIVDQILCETSVKNIQHILPPYNLSIPLYISAVVTHVVDPGNFWMQIDSPEFQQFCMFPLCDLSDDAPSSMFIEDDFCLAPFKTTGFYYRAKVLSILCPEFNTSSVKDEIMVNVFLVDIGRTQKVPLCELRLLPESAYNIPMLAIHCYLAGVAPVDGTWSLESIKQFNEFHEHYNVQTHVLSIDEGIYGVELTATMPLDENFVLDIAQMLYLKKHALDLKKFKDTSEKEKTNNKNLGNSSTSEHNDCRPMALSKQEPAFCTIGNRISCDSGVSVTSHYRPSTPKQEENYMFRSFDKLTKNFAITQDSLDEYEDDRNSNFESINSEESESSSSQKIMNHVQNQSKRLDPIKFDNFDRIAASANSVVDELKHMDIYPTNKISKRTFNNFDNDLSWDYKVPSPAVTFVEKDMMLVMMSKIVHPNEFYVNLAIENGVNFDELHEQMNTAYESLQNSRNCEVAEWPLYENMFCSGRYEDGNWYRLRILEVNFNQKQVEVQYIDYGNKAKINFHDLCPLSREFAKYPAFAIKCSLAYVTPKCNQQTDATNFNPTECQSLQLNKWDEHAIITFKKLAGFEKCLTAQVVGESNMNNMCEPLQVFLWDTLTSADLLINEALVAECVAEFDPEILYKLPKGIVPDPSTIAMSELNKWDPMGEDFSSIENSYGVDIDDIEIATVGYKSNDEKYICKFFARNGRCPRGSNCEYKHISCDESGVTRDQEPTYSFDSLPSLPESTTFVLLEISAIINPGHFYAVFPFGSKTVDEIDKMVNNGSSLKNFINLEPKSLFTAMNKHYCNAPLNENTALALACGSIVAAKSTSDGLWCRARVITVEDIAKPAEVFFVDFGNRVWVPRRFIREIVPEFLHTPFQAVECFLSDVEPKGHEKGYLWTENSRTVFQQLVENKILLAHVVHRSESVLHLKLKSTMQHDHQSISQFLVDEGHAQFISETNIQKTKIFQNQRVIFIPG